MSNYKIPGPIIVSSANIINESGTGNAFNWFDEQDTTLNPLTHWETPGNFAFWPASILIDLGEVSRITGIAIFEGNKSDHNGLYFEHRDGQLEIQSGKPIEWKPEFSVHLNNDGTWHFYKLDFKSRWIRLVKSNTSWYTRKSLGPFICDVNINEVVLYGIQPELKITKQAKSAEDEIPSCSFDHFIGVNTHSQTDIKYLTPFGTFREDHPWHWYGVESTSDSYSWKAPTIYDPENFYRNFINKVIVNIHGAVKPNDELELRPDFGNNPNDANSYSLISDYFFQFAARFGNSMVQPALIRTNEKCIPQSGLGIVSYMEAWSKPDKWWGDPAEHFTPYQLAAMASAVYDGHRGKMGPEYGAKQADPFMKIVLPGLSDLNTDYLMAIKFWSDIYRQGSFPADVISFHHFCTSNGNKDTNTDSFGISPESENLKLKLMELVSWRNKYLPDKEIWLSEFGWDSKKGSPYSATGHKNWKNDNDTEEFQAIWLVRALLIGAASGIDKMQIYTLKDQPGIGPLKSCGLLDCNNQPKRSWYYISTLFYSLSGMYYSREKTSGASDVWIYEFITPDADKTAFVIWCPTSDGTQVKSYKLNIEDKLYSSASQIKLMNGFTRGKINPINLTHGTAMINVTERPTIILLENNLVRDD
jgi:hypothetical protein